MQAGTTVSSTHLALNLTSWSWATVNAATNVIFLTIFTPSLMADAITR